MALIEFADNYEDLSTEAGFQFKFFCERCGNGYMSEFRPFHAGRAAGMLSALTGLRVSKVLDAVDAVDAQHSRRVPTPQLNKVIEAAAAQHPPPTAAGRRVKLYYATQYAVRPPRFVVFTNRPEDKKLILASMAELRHPAVLKALEPYTRDPALAAEAKAAIAKVKKAMKQPARLTASHNPAKARNAMDGNPGTRWDTGAPQRGGEWFMIELPVEQEISGLVLDTRGSRGDYPRGYEVYVSRDGKNWGKPVATGHGTKPVTEIKFKPTFGRFIKIVQTGRTSGLYWSIHEMKLMTRPLALDEDLKRRGK